MKCLPQEILYSTIWYANTHHSKHYTDVYLSRVYRGASASTFLITDIGEGDNALLCFTDLVQCCNDRDTPNEVGALGEWLFPNGYAVGTESQGGGFYVDRGPGVVRLNQRNDVTSPTGQFCCELPDATSINTRICINIVAIGESENYYQWSQTKHIFDFSNR